MQEPGQQQGLAKDDTYTCGQIIKLSKKQMYTESSEIGKVCKKSVPKKINFEKDWEVMMRRIFSKEHADLLPQLLENQWLFRFPDN